MDKSIKVEYSHEDLEKVYFDVSYNVKTIFDEVYRTTEKIFTYQKDFNHETNEFSIYGSEQNPKYIQGELDYQKNILKEINICFLMFKNGFSNNIKNKGEEILKASNFWENCYIIEKYEKERISRINKNFYILSIIISITAIAISLLK